MKFSSISKKTYIIIAVSCVLLIIAGTVTALAVINGKNKNAAAGGYSDLSSSESTAESVMGSITEENGVSSETVSSEPEKTPEINISLPKSSKLTVTEPKYQIKGKCNLMYPVKINGTEIACDGEGNFSFNADLKVGGNQFSVEYGDKKLNYSIFYRYVVLKAYDPAKTAYFDGEADFRVTALCRAGSKVTAQFNGQTLEMVKEVKQELKEDEFCNFVAVFKIPKATGKDQNLGKAKMTATYNGITETFYTGKIICKKVYIPQIAEVVGWAAETFDGNSKDNMTRPTNSYLPRGTVDYVTGYSTAVDGRFKNNFLSLRCGKRIYHDMPLTPGKRRVDVAKIYEGYLPDHNEIKVAGVSSDAKYTYITLDSLWKAPFFFDLKPQGYTDPVAQDYTVSSFTARYAEIKFCYATKFEGSIAFKADNPVFSAGEIIPRGKDTVVRLHFKKAGAFYGWDCDYNSNNQLVFKFRHPANPSLDAGRPYGINLSGIKIIVDAGHGGIDPGAETKNCIERDRNLVLANMIISELRKTGAEVIPTRTANGTTIYSDDRINMYRKEAPDFMVSVHHDSSVNRNANGFAAYYTTPFSQSAAKAVFNHTLNTGIYNNNTQFTKLSWHHFFMSRMTFCPGILTENGYVSSDFDRAAIMDNSKNKIKAEAIVKGITDYFKTLA